MLKPLTKTDYRQLFCAALRSGKYEQIEGEDWCGNKVCALGVGVREQLFDDNWVLDPLERIETYKNGAPADFYEDAGKKLGLRMDKVATIYGMNDREFSFEAIADWIESQP